MTNTMSPGPGPVLARNATADTTPDAAPAAPQDFGPGMFSASPAQRRAKLRSGGMILVFDIAGPLALYTVLRDAGTSTVTALIASGALPAAGVVINLIRRRHVDAIGMLVLAGIVVGTVLGLVTGSARLVLMEGSVPTALFGLACLGSLFFSRPLLLKVGVEFAGPDSPRGRKLMTAFTTQPAVARTFKLITAMWGSAYLAEAVIRVAVVASTSTGTAFTISRFMPWVVTGLLVLWTARYARHAREAVLAIRAA